MIVLGNSQRKGFKVESFDKVPSVDDFRVLLAVASQLWILSGAENTLSPRHLDLVAKFTVEDKHGLYLLGGPYSAVPNFGQTGADGDDFDYAAEALKNSQLLQAKQATATAATDAANSKSMEKGATTWLQKEDEEYNSDNELDSAADAITIVKTGEANAVLQRLAAVIGPGCGDVGAHASVGGRSSVP